MSHKKIIPYADEKKAIWLKLRISTLTDSMTVNNYETQQREIAALQIKVDCIKNSRKEQIGMDYGVRTIPGVKL